MRLKTIICLICLHSTIMLAQNQVMSTSSENFDRGRFEEVDSLLKSELGRLKGQELVGAYRMLALSAFYQDKFAESEQWCKRLLTIDPYFKAYGEDPRFQDMLDNLRKGTTISTASKQAESLDEAPVPVTIITEEMIRISGCHTVRELLCLFVPGMVRIEDTESNVALRGMYGYAQENILVMQDGHRLNSGATNGEAMDYDLSVDKIDHIEVLRGPASSLYGNVALSGVVNIFTKSGARLSGSEMRVRGGMHGTVGASYMYGQGDMLKDFAFWAAFTNVSGEKINVNGHEFTVGGFCGLPAFDLGLKARWNDFRITVTGNHSKPVPFYMILNFDTPYTYDKYTVNEGEKPGQSRTAINIDMDYDHTWGRFSLSANAFARYEKRQIYNVLGDKVPYGVSYLMLKSLNLPDLSLEWLDDVKTEGLWETLNCKDFVFGIGANGSWNYGNDEGQHGTVLAGLQYEHMFLTDSRLQLGYDYEKIHYAVNDIVERGKDFTASGIVQLKHYFIPNKLVFNGGLRYDHKRRFDDYTTNTFSPRAALIYLPSPQWSTRLSYSRAYVDAPYFYRASKLSLFSGSDKMESQTMDAFSLTGAWTRQDLGLRLELNAFFNMSQNQVVYSPTETLKNGGSPFYNAGHVNVGGVEFVGEWAPKDRGTYINMNATYQKAFRLENYGSTEGMRIGNIPEFIMNIIAGQRVVNSRRGGELWLRGNVSFMTATPLVQNHLSSMVPEGMMTLTRDDYADAIYSMQNVMENFPDETVRQTVMRIWDTFINATAQDLARLLTAEEKMRLRMFMAQLKREAPEDGANIEKLLDAIIGEKTHTDSFYDNGPQVMLNLGADWRIKYRPKKHDKRLMLSLDVYNVTNSSYKYGSLLNSYIPAQSISVVGKVGVEF